MESLTLIIHGSFLNAQLVKTFCAHWGNALALDFYIYAVVCNIIFRVPFVAFSYCGDC